MKQTKWIMGMPITVFITDKFVTEKDKEDALKEVFDYFTYVDKTFSTYKEDSEISRINRKEIKENEYSEDMKIVFRLSEKTRQETDGYFNIITPEGPYDPSGLVKGWSIYNAANILSKLGYKNFYVDAGGDIEVRGKNSKDKIWSVGIRDPFSDDKNQIVKTVFITDCGMATSGAYIRGQHIYNPHFGRAPLCELASITVIGPNVYEADRFATAAFAMGLLGINFIERLDGFEGYSIDPNGIATMTTGFEKFTKNI
jgi:thiamine biosynthesis lipoprotein